MKKIWIHTKKIVFLVICTCLISIVGSLSVKGYIGKQWFNCVGFNNKFIQFYPHGANNRIANWSSDASCKLNWSNFNASILVTDASQNPSFFYALWPKEGQVKSIWQYGGPNTHTIAEADFPILKNNLNLSSENNLLDYNLYDILSQHNQFSLWVILFKDNQGTTYQTWSINQLIEILNRQDRELYLYSIQKCQNGGNLCINTLLTCNQGEACS